MLLFVFGGVNIWHNRRLGDAGSCFQNCRSPYICQSISGYESKRSYLNELIESLAMLSKFIVVVGKCTQGSIYVLNLLSSASSACYICYRVE